MALTLMCPPATISAPSQCSDDQSRPPRAGTRCVPRCTCHWKGWYSFVLHQLLQSPIRLFSHDPFTLRMMSFLLRKWKLPSMISLNSWPLSQLIWIHAHPSPQELFFLLLKDLFVHFFTSPPPHFLPSLLAIRLCHGTDIILAPRDYWSTFWFYEWAYFGCFIYMESYIVWSLVSGFLHLLSCFWGSLVTEHISTLHSSLLGILSQCMDRTQFVHSPICGHFDAFDTVDLTFLKTSLSWQRFLITFLIISVFPFFFFFFKVYCSSFFIYLFIYLFIYIYIYVCVGSSFLCEGFL